jgi:hypothetical protein
MAFGLADVMCLVAGGRPDVWARLKPTAAALLATGFAVLSPAASAATQVARNPKTGLLTWKAAENGFSLTLQQLTSDNVRAIYEGMGASPAIVKRIAAYCVFGTDARNLSHRPISYNVTKWRAITGSGAKHRLRSKIGWQKIWKPLGVDYGFTIFPAKQTFEPGDWGEGFTTIKLPPGTSFDLIYRWSEHGKTYTGNLHGVRCAADR